MSDRKVEVLAEMYRRKTMEEFAAPLHPDAELHQARAIPDTGDYFGREEFVRGVNRWLEGWERFRFIADEIVDAGDDKALMRLRLSGRARSSGVELDQPAFHVWTFRDEMPWRCEVYFDEAPALEAAGLG